MDLRKIPKSMRWIFEQQKEVSKMLKPEIVYDEEVDILDIWFGGDLKTKYCIESEDRIIFNISNKHLIIGLEIMDFSRFLDQKHTKEVYKRFENEKKKNKTRKMSKLRKKSLQKKSKKAD